MVLCASVVEAFLTFDYKKVRKLGLRKLGLRKLGLMIKQLFEIPSLISRCLDQDSPKIN